MNGWPRTTVDELAERVDYGLTASATWDKAGPQFLRITDIQNGTVDWPSVPYCSCPDVDLSRYSLKIGDIVFTRTGATTGKSYLIRECPPNAVFASYLIRIRPNAKVDPRYLAYFFDTPDYWGQVALRAQGAGQPGINASKLKELSIPLPPLPEQKRIAAILDQADAIRRKRKEAVQTAAKLPTAIFLDMFGDPAINARGWPIVPFGELLSRGLRNGESPATSGAIRGKVLTLNAITGHVFDPGALKEAEFVHFSEDSRVSTKDLLICRGNGNPDLVGTAKRPTVDMPDTVFPDTMIAARVDTDRTDLSFVQSQWETDHVRRQILQGARTTNGTYKINQQVISSIQLVVPPMTIQTEFGNRVAAVRDILVNQEQALADTRLVFDSIVQRAFRGGL